MREKLLKEKIIRSINLPMYFWNRIEARAADMGTNRSGVLIAILEKEFGEVPAKVTIEEFNRLMEEPRSLDQKHLMDYRPVTKMLTLKHMLWSALDKEVKDRGKSRAYILGRMINQVFIEKTTQIKF